MNQKKIAWVLFVDHVLIWNKKQLLLDLCFGHSLWKVFICWCGFLLLDQYETPSVDLSYWHDKLADYYFQIFISNDGNTVFFS